MRIISTNFNNKTNSNQGEQYTTEFILKELLSSDENRYHEM